MIVTSLAALAVSVRSTLSRDTSNTATPPSPSTNNAPAPVSDSVQISHRAETLVKALDADGDGVVTKEEFTDGAIALLKRASVRFHHQKVGNGHGIDKRDERWAGRLEDVFAHADRNHDGAIDATELTSALPKAVQRPEQRQSVSATQTVTGSPIDSPKS